MTTLRPGRLCAAVAIYFLALGTAGAARAADQLLVGVNSVRFAWAAASGNPTGYVVSLSHNGGAYLNYASTVEPEIEVPVVAGDVISIRVAAVGYDSAGVYRTGPMSPISNRVTVSAAPLFSASGSWLLRCATCNQVMSRSLANASLVLAQAPGLAAPWRVLGMAQLYYGRDQVIWHDASTGRFAVYDGQFLAPLPGLTDIGPTALRGVGAADFDGDGMEEFVVQRTDTGVVAAWGVVSNSFIKIGTIPNPPGARLVAVRDFDRNGKVDLLWRDPAARTLDLWLLANDPTEAQPLTSLVSRTVRVASGLASDASVAESGDYDGDGHTDVLWRYNDGRLVISYLVAGALVRSVTLTPSAGDVDLHVVGSVDIGGTSGQEIALQDDLTGLIWILDPSTSGANTRTRVVHPGLEWQLVAIGW